MKIFYLMIVFFIGICSRSYSQSNSPLIIDDIVTIGVDQILKYTANSKIITDSFYADSVDFINLKFNKCGEIQNKKSYYTIYIYHDSIQKIKKTIKSNNQVFEFELLVYYSEYYNLFLMNLFKPFNNRNDGRLTDGFFISDKKDVIIYLGFDEEKLVNLKLFSINPDEKIDVDPIKSNYKISDKDITKLFVLSKELEPKYRINFKNGNLISKSEIRIIDNKLYESMHICSCSDSIKLKSLKISSLKYYGIKGCNSQIVLVIPNLKLDMDFKESLFIYEYDW